MMPCIFTHNHWDTCVFQAAKTSGRVIFGLLTCTTLGLVTMNCVIMSAVEHIMAQPMNSLDDLRTQVPNLFTRIGKFSPRAKAHSPR